MRARGLRVRDQDKTLPEVPHGGETPRREHRNGAGSVVSAVRGSGLREVAAATALHPSVPDELLGQEGDELRRRPSQVSGVNL